MRDNRWKLSLVLFAIAALGCATPVAIETREPEVERAALPRTALEPRSAGRAETESRPPLLRLLSEARFSLIVQDADLKAVLLGLGKDAPLDVVVDPAVEGRVDADFEGATLGDILDELVVRRGFRYELRGNRLIVRPRGVETRTFRLDYPNYRRSGESTVSLGGFIANVQTVGAGGGGAGGGGGGGGQQANDDTSVSSVETVHESDLWSEVARAIRAIVGAAPTEDEAEAEVVEEGKPRVIVSPQSGIIVVTASEDRLEQVEDYLGQVAESLARQVLIDAQIVEVTLDDDFDVGFDFESAPNLGGGASGVFERLLLPGSREAVIAQSLAPVLTEGGLSVGFARDNLGIVMRALAKQTDVRIVSTPSISTLNNHQAIMKVVRNEVFFVAEIETILTENNVLTQTEFVPQIVPVGVNLDVTPQISAEDEITLHVRPSVSEVVKVELQPATTSQAQNGSLPVIDVREADTVLRVADGTTLVIGGLVRTRELEAERKIPLLGDLPVLGYAFRGLQTEEVRTELLIFLTPSILDPPRVHRVEGDARERLARADALRHERVVRPWWRIPRFRSYQEVH